MLDKLAHVMDSNVANCEVWCMGSMNDEEIKRLKALVMSVCTFTVTSLSAYRGKRGLDPEVLADQ